MPTSRRSFSSTAISLFAVLLVVSCGGGSDSGSPMTAPSTAQPKFMAPTPADNVFTVGTFLNASAEVSVNGQPASDGTEVVFLTEGSATATVRSLIHNGTAGTTLQAVAPGTWQLRANLVTPNSSTTDTQQVLFRPPALPIELLVPAYFYPTTSSPWKTLRCESLPS